MIPDLRESENKDTFTKTGMNNDCMHFVKTCDICKHYKPRHWHLWNEVFPLCRHRRTKTIMTSDQLNQEVIPAKVIPAKPYFFVPESEIWPQYRPECIRAETCALWNLLQSSSYRCLPSLLAGCTTWKLGGNNHGSQIKLQGMAQVRVNGPAAIRCQCCNISVSHSQFTQHDQICWNMTVRFLED